MNNEIQTVDSGQSMISVIERAAADPNVDIDKMERLLAMQERLFDRQSEQAWTASMVECQREMPIIPVTGKNPQTNSTFAKLEVINKMITPVYTGHGFSVNFSQEKSEFEGCIQIVGNVSHIGGHTKRYEYDSPIDDAGIKGNVNKTPTHGRASAVSYGQRYLVKLIFNLILEGEDNDGNGGDNRSAIEIENWWVDHCIKVRDLFDSIAAIKTCIATENWDELAEVILELSNKEKVTIGRPSATKGGILTTKEQAALKSNELHAAKQVIIETRED